MATCDNLLRPEALVGELAIREATAEIVSRGCHHSESRPLFSLWWPITIVDPNQSFPL